jgi:ATP-binding cassette subfamily F protein uup
LKSLRDEHSQRVSRQGKADFSIEAGGTSGKIVAELEHVSHAFGGTPVISDLSLKVMRGDRIGFVGANGAGKSTLLKVLLGELVPQEGTVKLGTKMEIAYFDQLRNQLNPEQNLLDNVCGGRDFININGKDRHAISYLSDFLFSPDRVRIPVKTLSGGEQNRAILAKLFSKPANVLVLDEPTNDLDIETLELLEEILLDFNGTVLLVSHDREFMDHTVTRILTFDGQGKISPHMGGYSDWVARGGKLQAESQTTSPVKSTGAPSTDADKTAAKRPVVAKKKLPYKVQRELDSLPALIEELENRQTELEAIIGQADFYSREQAAQQETLDEMTALAAKLEETYARWEELDSA